MTRSHFPVSPSALALWLTPDAPARGIRSLAFVAVLLIVLSAVLWGGAAAPAISLGSFLGLKVPVPVADIPLWNVLALCWLLLTGGTLGVASQLLGALFATLQATPVSSASRLEIGLRLAQLAALLVLALLLATLVSALH